MAGSGAGGMFLDTSFTHRCQSATIRRSHAANMHVIKITVCSSHCTPGSDHSQQSRAVSLLLYGMTTPATVQTHIPQLHLQFHLESVTGLTGTENEISNFEIGTWFCCGGRHIELVIQQWRRWPPTCRSLGAQYGGGTAPPRESSRWRGIK